MSNQIPLFETCKIKSSFSPLSTQTLLFSCSLDPKHTFCAYVKQWKGQALNHNGEKKIGLGIQPTREEWGFGNQLTISLYRY